MDTSDVDITFDENGHCYHCNGSVSYTHLEHGTNLTHDNFLSVLGSMDLNLYMSYSESWGLVAYESEAMGVPCLMPQTADYLTAIKNALHIK